MTTLPQAFGKTNNEGVFAVSSNAVYTVSTSTGQAPNIAHQILYGQGEPINWQLTIAPYTVTIDHLLVDTHCLNRPINASISLNDGDYLAEFVEAEIVTSGDTADEAIRWLKETVVNLFEFYDTEREVLGPLPRRQLRVLEKFIGRQLKKA